MKQNSCAVVGEVTEPARVGLDELYSTVEAFCAGVADSVLAEVQQSFFMASEHFGYLFDGLQSASHGIVRPSVEESLGRALVAVAPELGEILLDTPSPAGLEVELIQCPKRDGLSAAAIGIAFQPRPFAACQW